MTVQRIIAGLSCLIAGWLLWGALSAVGMLVSRGSPVGDALLNPPTSIIRIAAASLIMLGGALLLAGQGYGQWVYLIGIALFSLMTLAMVLAGADASLWKDEASLSVVFWILFGSHVFTKRS